MFRDSAGSCEVGSKLTGEDGEGPSFGSSSFGGQGNASGPTGIGIVATPSIVSGLSSLVDGHVAFGCWSV
jgi:hypothetical protein